MGLGNVANPPCIWKGVSANMPLIIEVVDSKREARTAVPELKQIVGDNGLVTIQETYVI